MLSSHKLLPFHRLEVWDGNCFVKSSLFEQGFLLHVGHGGEMCPRNQSRSNHWEDVPSSADEASDGGQPVGHDDEVGHGDVMVITDTAGVFQHRVVWCTCSGEPGPDRPMQLFKEQLFPATYHRPKSAFTFNVLDYFYIDAMECKTAAMSFFQKLRRLTDNAFPGNVHVHNASIIPAIFDLIFYLESLPRVDACFPAMARFAFQKAIWLRSRGGQKPWEWRPGTVLPSMPSAWHQPSPKLA